ncbi:MAG TPA: histidine--tRNA ligase [Bacteroidia bacterium]|nr:histidine--tRNA ligase [Bacteroidia bacterium]
MKPSIPKGTRDFSPQEMVKRNYIFDTIRSVFKLYGYLPIETPSMENLDTLMGKYGEEGDRLIFKILNSGDYLEGAKDKDIKELGSKGLTKYISEKALRYDLTVPFARYVVMHQNDITFPFKRYQIQPVWRADRPQKGRYREFYQCDADVIGSPSLLNEVELIKIINDVFSRLSIPVVIKINNRKVLQGIAEAIGLPDRMIDIAMAIDKLDKIGVGGVAMELEAKGFTKRQIDKLWELVKILGTVAELIDGKVQSRIKFPDTSFLTKSGEQFEPSVIMGEGLNEMIYIGSASIGEENAVEKNCRIQLDISLARGLNYYTGTILEVKVDQTKCRSEFSSSICGGGRYDDLTGVFGLQNVSGVGISFGADRIYDVMEELNLFPTDVTTSTKVMFVNFGDNEAKHCLALVDKLRRAGISSELYPDAAKFKKQMSYADDKKIAYVVFVGADEISKGIVKLKNMASGEEKEIPEDKLIESI